MSEVLLVNPCFNECIGIFKTLADVKIREPLNVLTLGSYLKENGYDVKIIDAVPYSEVNDDSYLKRIEKELDSAICVGISAMTAQIRNALFIAKFIKDKNPNIPVIWGGVHPTLFAEQTSIHPAVDAVVYGEGEETLLDLVKIFEKAKGNIKNVDFGGVNGIVYKGKRNPPRELLDVNKLPFLDHDLLDLSFYMPRGVPPVFPPKKRFRKLAMLSSRGCPYRCTFCINVISGIKWRGMTSKRFLDEMEYLVDKYRLEFIKPLDENFFVNKKRVEEIVDGIKERGIDVMWASNIRANNFGDDYVSASFAKKLRDVGFVFAPIGAESGSDRILQYLKKDITTGQIMNSAKICNESGIVPVYSWIIGLPNQSRKEMISNIEIMKKINKICPSARFYDNFIFRPYPGGELYEECKQLGLHEPESLEEWSKVDIKIGYTSSEGLSWIKDRNFVEFLSGNSQNIVYPLGKIWSFDRSLLRMLLAIDAKVRWKLKFSGLYKQEMWLRKKVLNLFINRK